MSGWGGSSGGGLTPDFDFKASVRVATVVALPAYVQAGNVLTEVGVGALPLIDGVALVVGNRILVKNEGGGTSIANGIYVVTDLGSGATPWILTRSADADTDAEVTAGMVVPVEEGTVNADTLWILATNNPIVLNVTPLTFVPFITPTANASTVVKGVVEIATQAEAYAGAPYLGGTGAVLVPSITNLLVRREDPDAALYTIATGVAPASRGTRAVDFQSYRTAAAQVASGGSSVTLGIKNTASGLRTIALGYGNDAFGETSVSIGSGNVNSVFASGAAVGRSNILTEPGLAGEVSSGFGSLNFVGTAVFSGAGSSAFGHKNRIAQLAAATKASAFGYYNRVNNANYGSAFGAKNLVGSAGFTALKSSAFGYHNRVANFAATYKAAVVGTENYVDNTNNGTACGVRNHLGYQYAANFSSVVGYGNVIGSGAPASYSSAFGLGNLCNAMYSSSFGRNNQTFGAKSQSFGNGNATTIGAAQASSFGMSNAVGGLGFTAYRSSAFGYGNHLAVYANADRATTVGYSNRLDNAAYGSSLGANNRVGSAAYSATKSSACGFYNKIGQTANANYCSAFGYKNEITKSSQATALGSLNLVGSAAYTATKSSAFGYGNLIGQLGNANGGAAVGYKNVIDGLNATAMGYSNVCYGRGAVLGYRNRMQAAAYAGFAVGGRNSVYSNIGSAFGYRNTVGVLGGAYTATKSSAFGYKNQIAQTASADRSAAFGYNNRINKAINGSAVGTYNYIGTAAYNAFGGSAFGYFNRIGQVANATLASAFGYFNFAENTMAVAFGSINRVFGYKATGVGVQNFVGSAANSAYYSVAVGNHNYVGNLGGGNAAKANAFGYKNSILKSDYASAFGVRNTVGTTAYTATKSSAFGYNNFIGTTANADFTSAIGFNNVINNVTYGSAFGVKNLVGSTAYAAAKSSAFGYGNRVANLVTSLRANAFGFVNTVNNAQYGCAFGGSNIVGSAAFAATKGSAFGYKNRVGNTAAAINGNAFGYNNQVNAQYGCAFGGSNQVFGYRSASFGVYNYSTASQATAFGVFNYANSTYGSAVGVGNSVSGYKGSAFGYGCNVTASGGSAFGYNAINRIATTTVVNGPIMVRKDNGDGTTPALRFQIFNGAVVVLESQEIDFTGAPVDFEIALPAGVTWFFNEIDLKTTNVAFLATQPTVRAGIAGTPAKYLAATLTTLLTATAKRERYQTLLADDGESSAANLSVGFTVAAAAGTFKGRFILMGILEETQ